MKFIFVKFICIALVLNQYRVFTDDPVPIQQPCVAYLNYLSQVGADFLQCALNNSRPLSMCQRCARYYVEYKDGYSLMSNDETCYASTLYSDCLTCKNIIESADKVQIDYQIFSTIESIWSDANCDNCFADNYTLANSIVKFYEIHQNLQLCIANVTGKGVSLDPLFDNYTENSTLCTSCKDHYINLTNFFDTLGDENSVCMDAVDLYNYTRISWSKGYKCNYRDPDYYFVLITGIYCAITVTFYVSLKIFGQKEAKKLAVIHRRKPSSVFNNSINS